MGQTRQNDTRTELSRPGERGLTTRMGERGIQQHLCFITPFIKHFNMAGTRPSSCVITVEEGYVSQSYTLSLIFSLIIDADVSTIHFLSFAGFVHFMLYHFSCKMAWPTSLNTQHWVFQGYSLQLFCPHSVLIALTASVLQCNSLVHQDRYPSALEVHLGSTGTPHCHLNNYSFKKAAALDSSSGLSRGFLYRPLSNL